MIFEIAENSWYADSNYVDYTVYISYDCPFGPAGGAKCKMASTRNAQI